MKPPELATPMTSDRAPLSRGLGGRELRQAGRDRRAGKRKFADAALRRPVAQAERGLGVARLGRVAEEQQVGLRQREPSEVTALWHAP